MNSGYIPARNFPEKFLVAFSFAGEQRELVRAVAEANSVRRTSSSMSDSNTIPPEEMRT